MRPAPATARRPLLDEYALRGSTRRCLPTPPTMPQDDFVAHAFVAPAVRCALPAGRRGPENRVTLARQLVRYRAQ